MQANEVLHLNLPEVYYMDTHDYRFPIDDGPVDFGGGTKLGKRTKPS